MTTLLNKLLQKGLYVLSWIALSALILALGLNYEIKPDPVSINFDDGWVAALNYLPFSKYIVGKDYSYIYGPLWFLVHSTDMLPNKMLSQLFLIFEHISLALVFWYYRRSFPPFNFCIFASAFLLYKFSHHSISSVPSIDEYFPLIALILLLSMSLISEGAVLLLSSVLAGLLASILIFIKFDLSIEVIFSLAFYMLMSYLGNRPYPSKALFAFILVFVGSVCTLITMYFHSPVNFGNWFLNNIEISKGYIEGWSDEFYLPVLFNLGILIQIIYLWVIILSINRKGLLGFLGIVLLPSILLNFLHGFIRADCWHVATYLQYESIVLAILLCFCQTRFENILLLLCFCTMSFLSSTLNWANLQLKTPNNNSRFNSMQLPAGFLKNQSDTVLTYDGVPDSMMWCFANDLSYKPNPFIMLSQACSAKMDHQTAQYYSSKISPNRIFCDFSCLNQKHIFFETPETWRTLLRCYRPISFDTNKQILLLEKSQQLPNNHLSAMGSKFAINPNDWINVPKSPNLLFCSFDFTYNRDGYIRSYLFKIPAVFLDVKYTNGEIQSFRLIPGSSKNGLLINYLPEDMKALKSLFDRKANKSVRQFRLTGVGLSCFQSPISVQWLEQKSNIVEYTEINNVNKVLDACPNQFDIHLYFRTPPLDTIQKIPLYRKNSRETINLQVNVIEQPNLMPAKTVLMQIDNGTLINTSARSAIFEQPELYPSRESLTSAFKTSIDLSQINPGRHLVHCIVQSSVDNNFYKIPDSMQFIVE
jgi:hypothetical protein